VEATLSLPGLEGNRIGRDQTGTVHFGVCTTSADPPDGTVVLLRGGRRRLSVRALPIGGWTFAADGVVPWTLGSDLCCLTGHTGGRELSIDDIDFLRSAVIPRALAVHGLTVLHAASLVVNGGVVLACGPSGVGKSTLAAAFAFRRSAPLLGDDSVVVEIREGRSVAWACDPDIRLWEASRRLFDCGSGTALALYGDGAKARHRQPSSEAASRVHDVHAIIRLVAAPQPGLRRLRPADSVMALRGNLLRFEYPGLARGQSELAAMARLVECVPVYELGSPRTADSLDQVVSLVESCARPNTIVPA
jgi:hypothetical protein